MASRFEAREEVERDVLTHKLKNVLNLVMAIASNTLRDGYPLSDCRQSLMSRLRALAAMEDFRRCERPEGATFGDIVNVCVGPYVSKRGPRLELGGSAEELRLSDDHSDALFFIVQELAMNAAKYGAFSTTNGRVDLSIERQDSFLGDALRFRWRESGGPRVVAPLSGGFGVAHIQDMARHWLKGEASLRFMDAGLICEIEFSAPAGTAAE